MPPSVYFSSGLFKIPKNSRIPSYAVNVLQEEPNQNFHQQKLHIEIKIEISDQYFGFEIMESVFRNSDNWS